MIIPLLYLNVQVPVTGLKTQFRGGYVRDLAENLVKLAKVTQILIWYWGIHTRACLWWFSNSTSDNAGWVAKERAHGSWFLEWSWWSCQHRYLNFLVLHLEKDRLILCAPKLNFASSYIKEWHKQRSLQNCTRQCGSTMLIQFFVSSSIDLHLLWHYRVNRGTVVSRNGVLPFGLIFLSVRTWI
jgi:hypothetical protein